MGKLIRARRDGGVLEAVILALVAEWLALPRLEDDLERLAEARLTSKTSPNAEAWSPPRRISNSMKMPKSMAPT
jgi:hypothetical protein